MNFIGRLLLLCSLAVPVWSAIDVYSFDNDAQRQRYQGMIEELRCPKCQNQNLAGSNAPIAEDLRRELHRMILEGKDDKTIRQFMVQRYGNFILYRPPLDKHTLVLWSMPLLLLFAGLLIAIRLRKGRNQSVQAQKLTDTEKERLEDLLDRY